MEPKAYIEVVESPLGLLHFAANEEGVIALTIGDRDWEGISSISRQLGCLPMRGNNTHTRMMRDELLRYFDGKLRQFETPAMLRGTPFQERVWRSLRQVPYGAVLTYGELAQRAGFPKAARAVGAAMARNRIPIVLPCHRVIASGGGLGGFTGGLEIKRKLLRLEGALLQDTETERAGEL